MVEYRYHIFIMHSSADEHLGCFHVLVIVNRAVVNIDWPFASIVGNSPSGICPGLVYLGHMVFTLFLCLEESPHDAAFCILSILHRVFLSPYLASICHPLFFILAIYWVRWNFQLVWTCILLTTKYGGHFKQYLVVIFISSFENSMSSLVAQFLCKL